MSFNLIVDPYRVSLSINLKKDLNFSGIDNIFIDVDAKKLNDKLRTNWQKKVNEDDEIDELQFNEEDDDGHEEEDEDFD
jgi:hypothetical protein